MGPERVYYEDSVIKVTESFIAVHGKLILPLQKVQKAELRERLTALWITSTLLILSMGLVFWSRPAFAIVFSCLFLIDFLYYEFGLSLLAVLPEKNIILRSASLYHRTQFFLAYDAIQTALADFHSKVEEDRLHNTEAMRIHRIREQILLSGIKLTPELQRLIELPENPDETK